MSKDEFRTALRRLLDAAAVLPPAELRAALDAERARLASAVEHYEDCA